MTEQEQLILSWYIQELPLPILCDHLEEFGHANLANDLRAVHAGECYQHNVSEDQWKSYLDLLSRGTDLLIQKLNSSKVSAAH